MNKKFGVTQVLRVALALVLVGAIAACSQGGSQPQATNSKANLALTTSAAVANLPPAAGGSKSADSSKAATAKPQFAKVVAVKPIHRTTTSSHPRQVCKDEQVTVPKNYKDQHQIAGGVIGGVVGALVGHQVGGGTGKTLATIAGAAGGAYAGHEIQKHHQESNDTKVVTRNVCHTVTDKTTHTKTVAYEVTYKYNGKTGHVRMNHNPGVGVGLPVHNGVVVTKR